MLEEIKELIKELVSSLPINEDNKDFYREHVITVLGEKYSYRAEYDEQLFGSLVDEAINEKLNNVVRK